MKLLTNSSFERIENPPDAQFQHRWELQCRLLYSILVAGKSANFVDQCLPRFLGDAANSAGLELLRFLPFEILGRLSAGAIAEALHVGRTGNYTKVAKAIFDILEAIAEGTLDLEISTPEQLEQIHGIGPKTSRFFIIWTRPDEEYAALDVHVLRWLRAKGYNAPKATPQNSERYRELELAFIDEAHAMGKTARQLDSEIREAGAGRKQETTTP